MPIHLDNLAKIKQLDSHNMLGSLELLSKQAQQIWNIAQKLKVPASYKKAHNLVVLGMGGSQICTHIIKSVFQKELKISIEIVNDYHLPKYVDSNTLVIASSYSGSTEEVLNAIEEAKTRKAKLIAITSGGKLAQWFEKNKLPILTFTTEDNPCGQPRMGLGYMVFGQIAMLQKLGLLKLGNEKIKAVNQTISTYTEKFNLSKLEKNNVAKQIAKNIFEKSVVYVGSQHLMGNIHTATNQMNENAKRFANYHFIPEMNHHLLEGMIFPKNNSKNLAFVLIESGLYDVRTQKRYTVTKKVLEKNHINYVAYQCQEKDILLQACEVLVLGSFVSFYSAMLEGIDPTAIPFVDFFKAELAK